MYVCMYVWEGVREGVWCRFVLQSRSVMGFCMVMSFCGCLAVVSGRWEHEEWWRSVQGWTLMAIILDVVARQLGEESMQKTGGLP